MTQERHLGHPAESARAIWLRITPRLRLAVVRMV
jgi:hypothetical protein